MALFFLPFLMGDDRCAGLRFLSTGEVLLFVTCREFHILNGQGSVALGDFIADEISECAAASRHRGRRQLARGTN